MKKIIIIGLIMFSILYEQSSQSSSIEEDYDLGNEQKHITFNQGKSCKDVVGNFSAEGNFCKTDFIDEQFGYVLMTGERVVSQEVSKFYVTYDGGENWKETNHPNTMRLVIDGGFVDENIGFLSVGPINPDQPELHTTNDGEEIWHEATIDVPKKYEEIFLSAEMPKKEGNHFIMFVNQGPNGDYNGGIVKGKFISIDDGLTWDFVEEIEVVEAEIG